MSDDGGNIIDFRQSAPSAEVKPREHGDPKRTCKHRAIYVSLDEPLVECRTCKAIVDPYYWIRERASDWKSARDAVQQQIDSAKAELEELKTAVRLARREYRDAAEKARAESQVAMMPPRKRF